MATPAGVSSQRRCEENSNAVQQQRTFCGVYKCKCVRGGDHDRAAEGHALGEGYLDVARARRHIHQQIVQITPLCRQQQLRHDFGDDRPTYHSRRFASLVST